MHRYLTIILILTGVITTNVSSAKDYTKPPSVALRNEASYVSDVILQAKTRLDNGMSLLAFSLNDDLYNESDQKLSIKVQTRLAKNLSLKTRYLIAYQKFRKAKVNGIKSYVEGTDGPFLIQVEGANPAIFRYNEHLKQQLTKSPQRIKQEPQALLDDIFDGMTAEDPTVRDFFVRELINWDALHEHLKPHHYKMLLDIYQSNETSPASINAILEKRHHLHKGLKIENLATKAIDILKYTPTRLDVNGNVPTLILQALGFVKDNKMVKWEVINRWTQSNAPTIAETALQILKDIDQTKAVQLAKQRQSQSLIDEATRRTLTRFISQYSQH